MISIHSLTISQSCIFNKMTLTSLTWRSHFFLRFLKLSTFRISYTRHIPCIQRSQNCSARWSHIPAALPQYSVYGYTEIFVGMLCFDKTEAKWKYTPRSVKVNIAYSKPTIAISTSSVDIQLCWTQTINYCSSFVAEVCNWKFCKPNEKRQHADNLIDNFS